MKTLAIALSLSVASLLGVAPASADSVKCAPAAKKIKWNMCIQAEVEYKRGLKTEKRTECIKVVPIKAKGGCNLGDLASNIPKGTSSDKVVFYAVGPKGTDTSAFEVQKQTAMKECGLAKTSFDAYQLMKFSDAFDKSNRSRGELVKEKLAKKKKEILKVAVRLASPSWKKCSGVKSLIGQVDKKSQSKFLFYAESTNP